MWEEPAWSQSMHGQKDPGGIVAYDVLSTTPLRLCRVKYHEAFLSLNSSLSSVYSVFGSTTLTEPYRHTGLQPMTFWIQAHTHRRRSLWCSGSGLVCRPARPGTHPHLRSRRPRQLTSEFQVSRRSFWQVADNNEESAEACRWSHSLYNAYVLMTSNKRAWFTAEIHHLHSSNWEKILSNSQSTQTLEVVEL